MEQDEMSNLYRILAIDASHQVSVMNRNLVGSVLGRSSIKIANLVPIC
jgi:hypothetical protein